MLFRSRIGAVTPLVAQNRIEPVKARIYARVRQVTSHTIIKDSLSDSLAGMAADNYPGNGISQLAMRKLRRSQVEDTLDLHGFTIDSARLLLQQFLLAAMQNQFRYLLVIHGKGSNSPGGDAILRNLTRNWLLQHPQVLAFCPAPSNAGGSGAVLILLKVVACA